MYSLIRLDIIISLKIRFHRVLVLDTTKCEFHANLMYNFILGSKIKQDMERESKSAPSQVFEQNFGLFDFFDECDGQSYCYGHRS